MSRPSVFRRIASWLKNASNLNNYRKQKDAFDRMHRRYTVQTLEDRHMLSADFAVNVVAESVVLDNFTELVDESLTISETADDYRFVLSEGTWNGTNNLIASGAGTNDLRVDKLAAAAFTSQLLRISETIGLDIHFEGVNFNPITTFQVDSSRGNITQETLTRVFFQNLTVDGADNLLFNQIGNDIGDDVAAGDGNDIPNLNGFLTVTDTNNVHVQDQDILRLGRIDVNNDGTFESNALLFVDRVVTIGGDLSLNSNRGDIRQDTNAPLIVQGDTLLKSNDRRGGSAADIERPRIWLGFGDLNNDGLNDNDFVGTVSVADGSDIDIRDSNSITLGDVTTDFNVAEFNQVYVEAENGSITFDGVVTIMGNDGGDTGEAVGKLFIRATDGASQTVRGKIITDDLIIAGSGDFILDGDNELFDRWHLADGSDPSGGVSVEILGNLVLHTITPIAISPETYNTLVEGDPNFVIDATDIDFLPDGSGGNLTITTADQDLIQRHRRHEGPVRSVPLNVDGVTTFDVGTANITLNFGDDLITGRNDNDWNVLNVLNANNGIFVDANELIVGDINIANDALFETENRFAMFLDGEIVVGNNVVFRSDNGLEQTRGFVDASGALITGFGDFHFLTGNQLGDANNFGQIAADITSGDLIIGNDFGLEVSSLNAFGVNLVGIDGFKLDRVWLMANGIAVNENITSLLVFLQSDSTITQTATVNADELMISANGDVDLSAANNVATIAAIADGNMNYHSDVELTIGKLNFDAAEITGVSLLDTNRNNLTISTTDDDVHQAADSPVVVRGALTIDIGLGCLDFTFGDAGGDTINDNDVGVFGVTSAQRVELVTRNSFATDTIVVSDQIRLNSETGTISLAGNLTATNIVLLEAGNGVQQIPDTLGNLGVIDTAALMIQGTGDFLLNHDNLVGDAVNDGVIAVDINGIFEFNNVFRLLSRSLSFDLKDASTISINGFNVNTGGDALVLNVNGLTIENEIVAPKIVINTTGDVTQTPTGRFVTEELVLLGTGDYSLTALNRIGDVSGTGIIAIDVLGNVELTNELALMFDEIICGVDTFMGANLVNNGASDGDLTLTTLNGDITQANDSILTVVGRTTLDVGTGQVDLTGFPLLNNDFNTVSVGSADTVELIDANQIILETTNITSNLFVQSGAEIPSQIILDDNIFVGSEMLLSSILGVNQQRGQITTDSLYLDGSFDFNLLSLNEIDNLAANITGNLNLLNDLDLNLVKRTYTQLNGDTTSFGGVEIDSVSPFSFDGNLAIETTSDDVTQDADAHLKVLDTALFDLGLGDLELNFADSNTDTLNDNDVNVLAIASAGNAEFTDFNSVSLDNVLVANNLFVESEGGSISIQNDVIADNSILLRAKNGAGTSVGAFLDTDNLLVEGEGSFDLNGSNRLGSVAVAGNVAIDVKGDVLLNNLFGTHFNNLNFTQLDATNTNIAGVFVQANGFDGNFFSRSNGDITDDATADVIIEGNAAFAAGVTNDVILGDTSTFESDTLGLGGRNANIHSTSNIQFAGVNLRGNLDAFSTGDISQTGIDASGIIGNRAVIVDGDSIFTLESTTGAAEELNVNLLSVGGELINNRFGNVVFQGTSFTGGGSTNGLLNNIKFRNSAADSVVFPTINRAAGDSLMNLTIWAPNSSLTIKNLGAGTDYDVTGNMTLLAGTDTVSGFLGDAMKVTNNQRNRSIRDQVGVEYAIGGNFNANAANTMVLADNATDVMNVGGTLSLVNQGGLAENRIRLGVGSGGLRGDDSGAVVNADKVRFRAKREGTDGHVTLNVDNDLVFTNSNFATSLVAVSGGDILDDFGAGLTVVNAAFFDANGGAGDVTIGDDNANNRDFFGSVGFNANNVSISEDSQLLLGGSNVAGDLDVFANGSIRQTGIDSSGRAGTEVLEVGGSATFTVDGTQLPGNHLNDPVGRDINLMNNGSRDLLDNNFQGDVTFQTTQQVSGGMGTLRSALIRNVANNATVPTLNIDATDQLRNLMVWFPNNSVVLQDQGAGVDYNVAGTLSVFAGVDSTNGKVNGNLTITDNSVVRSILDQNNVSIAAGRANFFAANSIILVEQASNSLVVDGRSRFESEGGAAGNRIDVGTQLGNRGTDSGGLFETDSLRFFIENTGVGGNLTIVLDATAVVDPTSFAPSVVLVN